MVARANDRSSYLQEKTGAATEMVVVPMTDLALV
jgi:hypothetical protein